MILIGNPGRCITWNNKIGLPEVRLVDELLKDYKGPESFRGESGMVDQADLPAYLPVGVIRNADSGKIT